MNTANSLATRVVRAWTSAYTRGLPKPIRNERIAEIESDLWEQTRDGLASSTRPVWLRLVLGMPLDLAWRLETGAAIRSGKEP
jgi:hypothetical protein